MVKLLRVLVLLLLFAGPDPAAAACSWVLWYFEAPFGWSSLIATVTKNECDQQAREMFANARISPELLKAPELLLTRYQCFPDTVDPRGAKRK